MILLLESRQRFLDPLNEVLYFPERKSIPGELEAKWSKKRRTLIPISDTGLLSRLILYSKKVGKCSPSWFAEVGPSYIK